MKISKYISAAFLLAATALLSGCQTDYDEPTIDDYKATLVPNTKISELKDMVAANVPTTEEKEGVLNGSMPIPLKDEAAGLPYIIKGRVVSSDISGNIFKLIVIQDETGAIQLSVNQGNLYTNYRVGQEVVINVSGLWGGFYHSLLCLGWGSDSHGTLVTSRMAPAIFFAHTQLNGLPDEDMKYLSFKNPAGYPADHPYTIMLPNLSSFPTAGSPDFYALQSQLVEIPDVYFEAADGETTFSIKDSSGVSRVIKDANGGSLDVRNSGYSNFYNTKLPQGHGTIRGILSYYGTKWQLVLRDLDDVMFGDIEGSEQKPYTVDQVLDMDNNGRMAWVGGYIVGSVKAGVSEVKSADDVIFGNSTRAQLDNNLLIASTPDCTDVAKCVVVALSAGDMRQDLNLIENPNYIGMYFTVYGTFSSWLNMHGVVSPGNYTLPVASVPFSDGK